ncbi:MAG TPA: VTT domain-containing protein [Candidatus Paceibacterota bacterium]|nr:VTT domain-containing protein [Candidatus Paceibacterota bacterium]
MKIPPKGTLHGEIAALLLLAITFIAVSVLAERYHAALATLVTQGGILGVAAYILLTAVFVIFIIPLDIALLIPIGAVAWGPLPTALMSIAGWTLGAAIAFLIARRFGEPVVARLIGLERIRAIESRIPKRNLFWMVVLMRILVSVDILSYALGLFSAMPWRSYVVATAIGVAPFGFYFAYTGALPLWYRVAAVAFAVALATLVILRYGVRREP